MDDQSAGVESTSNASSADRVAEIAAAAQAEVSWRDEQAVAQRMVQEEHAITSELRGIAEQLSFLKAGPRGIIDIHVTALQRLDARHDQAVTYAEEARWLILELMGSLVSIHRNTSLGNGAWLRRPGG